jgi:hypothetical protein
MTADDRLALYAAPQPETTHYVGTGGQGLSFRTYFCRCHAEDLTAFRLLDYTDLPWRCGGHPSQ